VLSWKCKKMPPVRHWLRKAILAGKIDRAHAAAPGETKSSMNLVCAAERHEWMIPKGAVGRPPLSALERATWLMMV